MSADKLASFRVDSQLWEVFQGYAKENNVTATALLISYIKSVVNTGNVITYNPVVNTSSEVNNPSQSIQDIDKRIDDKIKMSIQNINILSIQDIDNRIAESLADGGIGEAIATSYAATMGQFNGLLEELQDLKKQFEELQSNPPATVPTVPSPQSPITNNQSSEKIDPLIVPNHQLPVTPEDVSKFLGIADILAGDQYWEDKLIESGINQKIVENVSYLSEKLNIKVSPKGYVIARFNLILDALGYGNKKQGQHTKPDGKKQDKYLAIKVTK
ncbi:hypothetical protein [Anabaena sp. UHCC 0204]|uniref:hypothetical protein n=1 Tax=Anabaena sp. UHCC 0204 TaxID=2590009 RepID=UPI00144566C1|nr:hypothetical protein [Anabaena sp. UHCC 0204]